MVQEVSGEGRVPAAPGQIGLRPEPASSLGHSATVPSRMAFIIAASAIERDARISELTDAEIDGIIGAVSACSTDALDECELCDGQGRVWNNADPTSGQFHECYCVTAPSRSELIASLTYAVKLLGAFPALNGTAQVQHLRRVLERARVPS